MNWRIIKLDTIDSTNDFIKNVDAEWAVVTADYQQAGRGQGQNKWESERGKNLLFSLKMPTPPIPANMQYLLSMAGALALKDALDGYVSGFQLKWPNDIYWENSKISGTLIETAISGRVVQKCIYGIGINVNQRTFVGDAPNPISLCRIVGREIDRDELLQTFLQRLENFMSILEERRYDGVVSAYNKNLYRRVGFYEYEDKNGRFEAEIAEVKSNGYLVLRDRAEKMREYELKEVKFII
jgi:BirA family biotin operon repressor/biotin-[acetyl-CoA-carboxylase] ligase